MHDAQKDVIRATSAMKEIVDGRDPQPNMGKIMVTLEHTVAGILLAVMGNDAKKAAGMLNEGLVPGVEKRLGMYAAKKR